MIRVSPPYGMVYRSLRVSLAMLLFCWSLFGQLDKSQLLQQMMHSQGGEDKDTAPNDDSGTLSSACSDPDVADLDNCDFQPKRKSDVLLRAKQGDMPDRSFASKRLTAAERGTSSPTGKAPERPSEFQKFVKTATGESLPVYGSWLFDDAPSTFAPVDHVPVTPDYTIGPSDEVDVRVWGQINFSQRLLVDRSGDVFIPQVGRVSLSGLRYAQVQDTVRTAIGRVYKNFDLNVNMGQLRSLQVFVVGEVKRPGTYTISSLSTLVNALFVSGGPSARGSMRNIELKRQGQVITKLDLYDLLLKGDKSGDAMLQGGDVIFVPRVSARIAVSGSVETPAIYETKADTTLAEVLGFAGGMSPVAAGQQAVLQRIDQHAAMQSTNVQLTKDGLATCLQDGDIVRLLSIVQRFDKVVTIRGNVADAMRFPWYPGMKVSSLIPDKQFLLTRDYWTEHNKTSSGSGGFKDETTNSAADTALAAIDSARYAHESRHFLQKNDVRPPAADINWNYAAVERLDPKSLTTHLIPFNLGKAVIEHDSASDVELQAGDVVNVFSTADFATPKAEQTMYVHIEGEVHMAGAYSIRPGDTLRQIVARAGGLTPRAYLYGAEFTRESTKEEQKKRFSEYIDRLEDEVRQNTSSMAMRAATPDQESALRDSSTVQRQMLERLRQSPASGRIVLNLAPDSKDLSAIPDIPLENGDRYLIPSTPDVVHVVGAVYNQSSFLFAAESRVANYLDEAGGATRYADRKRPFIIRADGSVVSKGTHGGFLGEEFKSLKVFPGDTLVVPSAPLKIGRLRSVLDMSQMVSGFGVSTAAANVLR